MANPVKGEVSFEAEGETYTLVFDFNAICEIEDEFGIDASELGEVIGKRMTNVRKLFRVGLSRRHQLDEKATGDIISAIGPQKAVDLISEAFKRSFPEAAEGTARPQKGAGSAQTT